jgi:hypothetical protein
MNDPRQGAASAMVGETLYVCGGSDRVNASSALASAEFYDKDLNRWRRVHNMNTARVGCCAVAVGGKLCVIGGRGPDLLPLSSVEAPRPWPTPLLHGTEGAPSSVDPATLIVVAWEVYSEATDSWTFVPDMPTPRQDATCAVLDGKVPCVPPEPPEFSRVAAWEVYVMGGFDGKESLDLVEVPPIAPPSSDKE